MTYDLSHDDAAPVDPAQQCAVCGGDRRGLAPEAPCPRCAADTARRREAVAPPPPGPAPTFRAVRKGDPKCDSCGYNLRGTPVGAPCPECGAHVVTVTKFDAELSRMPVGVIRRFRLGAWLAVAAMLITVHAAIAQFMRTTTPELSILLLVAAVAWQIGAIALTPAIDQPEAIRRGFRAGGRLRLAARFLQSGWVLAAALVFVRTYFGAATGTVFTVSMGLACLVGAAGTVILAILLERLSEWARDEYAERAFNYFEFAVPTLTFVGVLDIPILFIGPLLAGLWLTAVYAFVTALLSMGRSVTLSVRHAHEHAARDLRIRERRQREEAERGEMIDQVTANTPTGERIHE